LFCVENTPMDIDFDVLKYIKKICKVSILVYFEVILEDNIKKLTKESKLR